MTFAQKCVPKASYLKLFFSMLGPGYCLCAEEFNDKILCPDLNEAEMQRLHGEVQNIYKTYCLDESIDKIRFDPFIVEEIRNSE